MFKKLNKFNSIISFFKNIHWVFTILLGLGGITTIITFILSYVHETVILPYWLITMYLLITMTLLLLACYYRSFKNKCQQLTNEENEKQAELKTNSDDIVLALKKYLLRLHGGLTVVDFDYIERTYKLPPGSAKQYITEAALETGCFEVAKLGEKSAEIHGHVMLAGKRQRAN